MISALLALGFVLFAVATFVVAYLNGNTPMQFGPIPVLGGAFLALACLVALLARHLVWR